MYQIFTTISKSAKFFFASSNLMCVLHSGVSCIRENAVFRNECLSKIRDLQGKFYYVIFKPFYQFLQMRAHWVRFELGF